ncbi:major histocompatibility complex class I-related gene protein-like [Heptranchias perlo]|uniref:major histocompatibility complex class I-related gene protein-like n=1 Tax=Heptranchias perlo TaxID=212740 RepID=UPI00355A48C8
MAEARHSGSSNTRAAHEGSHTFEHLYIFTVQRPNPPDFSVVGKLDDLQTDYYNSSLKKPQPRQQWMADNFTDDYWLEQAETADSIHKYLSGKIDLLVKTFSVTYFQGSWGCTLYDNKSTNGFIKLHLDHIGGIQYDTNTERWTATGLVAAFLTKLDQIPTNELPFIQSLNASCIHHLQKALLVGKPALERKVAPKVLVFKRTSAGGNATTLLCLITAFYPRSINATWLRNGKAVLAGYALKVLPNHDETYRMEILIETDGQDRNSYSCQVQHSSLPETLTLALGSGVGGSKEAIRSAPVLGLVAVLATIAGLI